MILGIDPGVNIVGYGFVAGSRSNPQIIDFGIVHTDKKNANEGHLRLLEIATDLEYLLNKHKPNKAVVEDLFFFKNEKTVISVAQSRGMIIYLLAKHGIEVESVTPLQVKNTLCGYGRATKKQVQEMVKKVYKLDSIPQPDDAADALAIAWMGL
jgi:crossover junction endodeoxyribonuclease RuvC